MSSITPYGLRMPRELKEALEIAAHENGRSLNSEIVARLEASVRLVDHSRGLAFVQAAKSAAPNVRSVTVDLETRVCALEAALAALTANSDKTQK